MAVIGSGPAGLCAAAQLNRAGHCVTVFERADRPGGLLMYGIPNMKLDKTSVVLRRLQLMMEGRHQVRLQHRGRDRISPPERLLEDFDAVVLCTGATKPRDLPIEGRELKGVHFAMEFLTANTKASWRAQHGRAFISAEARMWSSSAAATPAPTASAPPCATAAAAWSSSRSCRGRRNGAAPDNPWPEWPKVYRMDYGQEEAAARFGADPRVYLTTAKQIRGRRRTASVTGCHWSRFEWKRNEKGQFVPEEVAGTERSPGQLVLLAMGFLGPEQPLLEQLGLDRDARSNVQGRVRDVTRRTWQCSPPATAAAARAWWSGPSTRAAARRASATAT